MLAGGQAAGAEARTFLGGSGVLLEVKADEVIERGNPHGKRSFRVLEGIIRASIVHPDGRRQVLRFAFPGSLLGFTRFERGLTIEAVTKARLLEFNVSDLRSSAYADGIASELASILGSGSTECLEQIAMLGRRDPAQRLAMFIQLLHRHFGAGEVVRIPMKRADIADFIGLNVETVSRAFGSLRRARVIKDQGRSIVRIDLERLGDMVQQGG
jgi:CRP-like cAMP-binding protein